MRAASSIASPSRTSRLTGFWQYQPAETACAKVPAPTVSTDELWKWMDEVGGFAGYTDQGMEQFLPYYYQAGTQLGLQGWELVAVVNGWPQRQSAQDHVAAWEWYARALRAHA